ncbi:MAG: hypothetical protein WAV90_22890 [Gordonia amarae]
MTAAGSFAGPVPREQQIPDQLSGVAVGFGVAAVILGGLASAGTAFIVDSGVGVGISSSVVAMGLGVLVAFHAAQLRHRSAVPGFPILGSGARFGYVLLGATALSLGLATAQQLSADPGVVRLLDRFGYTLVSALAGVCAAIAAMVVAVSSTDDQKGSGRTSFVAGFAVAVVGSMAITATAHQFYMHFGQWSPTVAAKVDVPEGPDSVGGVAYRIRLDETPELVLGIGAGFLVKTGPALTAYDGLSGKVRWRADFGGIGTGGVPMHGMSYARQGYGLRVRSGPVLFTLDDMTGAVVKTERVDEHTYRPSGLTGVRWDHLDELDYGYGVVSASREFADGTPTIELRNRTRSSGKTTRTVIPVATEEYGQYQRPNLERVGQNIVVTGREKLFVVDPDAGRVVSAHTNPCSVEGDSRLVAVPGALLVWCRPTDWLPLFDDAIVLNEIVGLVPPES